MPAAGVTGAEKIAPVSGPQPGCDLERMGEGTKAGKPIDLWISELVEALGELTSEALGALASARAWDEVGKEEEARRCRERAVRCLGAAEGAGEGSNAAGIPGTQLLLADTLRRLGRFEDAVRCCRRGLSGRPPEPLRSVLEFELELVANRDSSRHSVDEVI